MVKVRCILLELILKRLSPVRDNSVIIYLFIYSIFFIQGCLFSINTAFQESPVNMNIDK